MVIGIEWDEDALSEAKNVLMPFGDRVKIFRENFIHLPDLMKVESVDGILLDLGLSSIQLEKEERGFSFIGEGPLDMRMDRRMDQTADDLVNHLSLEELEYTLLQYGEERWARKIAKAIVYEREREPIQMTQTLRRIVHHAIPRRFHSRRIDPATKTFQALRIRVNDELENLRKVLETGWKILKKGGRMCVISFHSLEDRMVKKTFRKLEKEGEMRVLTQKPVTPSEEEERRNPRSRSAKLRCAERI
jgi:16S rRNA (cytosine1402-N4)-methyltransferase